MRLLLDTHALLWYLLDDPKLSKLAKTSISDTSNTILVSPASYWEIAIKISIGKYHLHESLDMFMERELSDNGFSILPIAVSHAAKVTSLPFHHRDPFDRLVIAQALHEDIPIVGADVIFDDYGVTRIW